MNKSNTAPTPTKSGVRTKFLIESLRQEYNDLCDENDMLREIVERHLPRSIAGPLLAGCYQDNDQGVELIASSTLVEAAAVVTAALTDTEDDEDLSVGADDEQQAEEVATSDNNRNKESKAIDESGTAKEFDVANKFEDLKSLLSRKLIEEEAEDEPGEEEKESEWDIWPTTTEAKGTCGEAPKSLAVALNITKFDDTNFGKGSKLELLRRQEEKAPLALLILQKQAAPTDTVITNMEEGMMNHSRSDKEVLARKEKRRGGSDRKVKRRDSHGSHSSRKSHRSHGSRKSHGSHGSRRSRGSRKSLGDSSRKSHKSRTSHREAKISTDKISSVDKISTVDNTTVPRGFFGGGGKLYYALGAFLLLLNVLIVVLVIKYA